MPKRAETVGVKELRALFGVNADTIREWRLKGMPHRVVANRPRFVVADCVQWRREQDAREQREQSNPKEADERARKLTWDANAAELKYKRLAGQLADVADVERQTARLCDAIRSRVLAIRGRWAARAIGLQTMTQATALFDQIATDILAALESSADELEDGELTDDETDEGHAA